MKCCCRWNWTWSFDVLSGCSRRSTPAAPTHPAVAGNWRSRCQQNRYHNSCQAASRNQASNISSEADGSCPHCTSCSCHQASVAGKVTTKSGSGRRGRQGQEIVKQWGDKKASNILLADRAWKQCNNDVFLKFGTMPCRCLAQFGTPVVAILGTQLCSTSNAARCMRVGHMYLSVLAKSFEDTHGLPKSRPDTVRLSRFTFSNKNLLVYETIYTCIISKHVFLWL